MDYTQERVTTVHDYGDADPPAPTDRAGVVVPMTDRDAGGLAAERLFDSLETLDLSTVVVPIRTPPERVSSVLDWLSDFEVPLDPLWCNGPELESTLAAHDLDGAAGKGRDVWLALGIVADVEYLLFHDADVSSHETRDVRKLLAPLANGYSFSKAYYARVENETLYGRLFRLLYDPLVSVLGEAHDAPLLRYLGAFRYALAGEAAMRIEQARAVRVPQRWGLEVGVLGDVFATSGFRGSVQVDLGRYEHDHRAVTGPAGLTSMAGGVAGSIFQVLEDAGIEPDYATLRERYEGTAKRFVEQYRDDARYNGFEYDESAEREQVTEYGSAIGPPGADDRLPAWENASVPPETIRAAVDADLDRVQ